MRSLLAVFALALAVLLGVSLTPAQAAKAPVKQQAGERLGREVVSLRTAGSKTFGTARGRRVTRVYAGPVHFRDGKGRWRDIDTTLRPVHGRYLNRTNRFSASLPGDIGKDSFRVRRGSAWLSFALREARGTAQVRGSVAKYRAALPGVDATYRLLGGALKENLILRGPESRRRFVFDLEMRKGLRPSLLRTKAIILRDKRNKTRMTIAAPFTIDRRGKRNRASVKLANVDGRWRMTLTASSRWLDRGDRAWPVTLDPAVYPTGDTDCDMNSSAPNTSTCSDAELWVGRHGTETWQGLLRFNDLAESIPRGAEVHGASLVLNQLGAATSTNNQIEAYALAEPFTSAATWNSNNGTDRWSEPGGEFDPATKAEYDDTITQAYNGERYIHMFKVIREWASGKRPNYGLLLKTSSTANGGRFGSTENSNAAVRPYLNLVWSPRIGERRGYVHERQRITDRISLGVNVAAGNLNVTQTDFSMPGGLGPAVSVARSYNSSYEFPESYGNWHMSTGKDFYVFQQAGGRYVVVHYPGGAEVPYTRDPASGTYTTPAGYDNKLTRNDTTQTYELVDNASQTKYRFAAYTSDGRLNEVEDRNGRKLTFIYDGSNQLTRIEDSNNDTGTTNDDVRFTYTSGQITGMTDPASRTYAYGYAGTNLTSYTDPQNGSSYKTLYEYAGPNNRLSKITTPQGNITTIEYYASGEAYGKVKAVTRVTNTTTLTGDRTEFAYVIRRDGSGETRVTDPIGSASRDENDRITSYTFDADGRVTETKDALGRVTKQKITSTSKVESYSAASNSGTTPNTTLSFDSDDNQTGAKTPVDGGSITGCADYGTPNPNPGTTADPKTESCDAAPSGGTYNGVSGVAGSAYLPGRSTDAQGNRRLYGYNAQGMLTGVEQTTAGTSSTAPQHVASTTINRGTGADGLPGRVNSVVDERSGTTAYGYGDGKGNITSITPPTPLGATTIAYNLSLARIEVVRDGKGNCRVLGFDNLDRLTSIEFRGACTSVSAPGTLASTEGRVVYTYDRDGNQTSELTREDGTTTERTRTMQYDKQNRVTYEALPGGSSNTYTYDAVGNLRTLTDGGGKTEYTYDQTNQVRAVYEPGVTTPTKFEHDQDGLRRKTFLANGVTIENGFDTAFRLTSIKATKGASVLQDLAYKYQDPDTSRQTPLTYEKTDTLLAKTTKYGYDGLDRLLVARTRASTGTWASNPDLAVYGYRYDGTGNITKRSVSGSQLTAGYTDLTYNAANQLCAQVAGTSTSTPSTACPGSPAFTYDANGNQTAAPGRTASYNGMDQTTAFTISSTTTALTYLGAGQDRWINEGTPHFQHNVLGVGKRGTSGGNVFFVRDEGGRLVSRRSGGTSQYYLHDALGSVSARLNADGTVAERYYYEPYGGQDTSAAGGVDVAGGEFGFAGGYRTTMGGLYHYGQRFYDPGQMRWTQTDPLDQTGDLSEGNRYSYVGGDPVGAVDPSGMLKFNVDLNLGPVKVGASIDDDGNVGVSGGVGSGTEFSGSATVGTGKVEEGTSAEASGCVAVACGSVSTDGKKVSGGASAGVGVGTGGSVSVKRTKKVADLW